MIISKNGYTFETRLRLSSGCWSIGQSSFYYKLFTTKIGCGAWASYDLSRSASPALMNWVIAAWDSDAE